jgi:hypothetical protein
MLLFLKKKAYACWFNVVKNFFTTYVNPRKLLEKSGTKSEEILVLRPSDGKM